MIPSGVYKGFAQHSADRKFFRLTWNDCQTCSFTEVELLVTSVTL